VTGLLTLAARSAWNRRFDAGAGGAVDRAGHLPAADAGAAAHRTCAQNFSQAVSGTDLIVGARTGPVQLMLYAVFRIGGATNNITMGQRAARWRAPRGGLDGADVRWATATAALPVLGTTPELLHALPLRRPASRWCWPRAVPSAARWTGCTKPCSAPRWPSALGYTAGPAHHVLSHGDGAGAANDHADKPFTVVGVLARTGTPVDRTVHVSLQAWKPSTSTGIGGAPLPASAGMSAPPAARKFDLTPQQVTARWWA
jgi:putative ABC transport system permease protein